MINTRIAAWLLFPAVAVFALTPSVPAQTINTDSQPAAAAEKSPPIPEEARKCFVMGATVTKEAKSVDDFSLAISKFKRATELAPQWPEARYNLATVREKAGDYAGAIADWKVYLQFKLPEDEARKIQDNIYALEAKQELAAKTVSDAEAKKEAQEQQAAKAKDSFDDLLAKIDGRRYTAKNPSYNEGMYLDIRGKVFVRGAYTFDGRKEVERQRFEIKGYQTTLRDKTIEGDPIQETFTISEDGDRITEHTEYANGKFWGNDSIYLPQR